MCASNAIEQILFCWVAVLQCFSIFCQYGAITNAFAMHRVAKPTISKSLALTNWHLLHMQRYSSLSIANSRHACLIEHIEWWWVCRRPMIEVSTLPAVSITTTSITDSFCSSCLQWICIDRAGLWLRDGGRQGFKSAESSRSASNAGCGTGYKVMHWVLLCGSSECGCAITTCAWGGG